MSKIAIILPYSVDLDRTIGTTILPTLFATGNNLAHRFELTILKGGKTMDLSGVSVTAKFVRCNDRANGPNGSTVEMAGSPCAFIEDGKAVVVLKDACYTKPGKFTLTISLTEGETITSVFRGEGGVTRSGTDSVVTDEQVITLDAIFAQMTAMKNATQEAEEAADEADMQAAAAKSAASSASTAAAAIDGMTASATAGSAASVTVTKVNGVWNFAFELPKGDKGDKGEKGDPGTIENVTITSIDGLAEALAAKLDATATAADSQKLGGKTLLDIFPVGFIWPCATPTSPASIIGGTWERIEDKFILAAGPTYAAGSTGGEATHKLTITEMPAHTHGLGIKSGSVASGTNYSRLDSSMDTVSDGMMESTGGSMAHNNMPPYEAHYVWKRVS